MYCRTKPRGITPKYPQDNSVKDQFSFLLLLKVLKNDVWSDGTLYGVSLLHYQMTPYNAEINN